MSSEGEMVNETRLLEEFDELVEAVEEAATDATWRLGDWLVANVPSEQGARNDFETRDSKLTLKELAKRADRSPQWFRELRLTAEKFPPRTRLPGVSVKASHAAYQREKSVEAALISLREKPTARAQEAPRLEEARRIMADPELRSKVMQQLPVEQQIQAVIETLSAPKTQEALQNDLDSRLEIQAAIEDAAPPAMRQPRKKTSKSPRSVVWAFANAHAFTWSAYHRLMDAVLSDEDRRECIHYIDAMQGWVDASYSLLVDGERKEPPISPPDLSQLSSPVRRFLDEVLADV